MRKLIYEYRAILLEIIELQEKADHIYLYATSPKIKNITGMPMAPGFSGGGLENTFIQIEGINQRIAARQRALDECAAKIDLKLIQRGITGISRDIFWCREIYNKKWSEISRYTGKSVRQIQRIYKKSIYTSSLL